MGKKHIVVQGAWLKCQYGTTPDQLKVNTQTTHFVNDKDKSTKLMATDKDIGPATMQANTFGLCKLQPTPGGYKPCQAILSNWSGAHDRIVIKENGGHPLLETSKATCPIGGPDCIEVTDHGQIAQPTQKNVDNASDEVLTEFFPFVDLKEDNIRKSDDIEI